MYGRQLGLRHNKLFLLLRVRGKIVPSLSLSPNNGLITIRYFLKFIIRLKDGAGEQLVGLA